MRRVRITRFAKGREYSAAESTRLGERRERGVRIRLTRSFASGDMNILLYEVARSARSLCSGQTAYIFGVPPGTGEAEAVRTDLGGKTIRTVRLYRNHNGGSTAEASFLKILETEGGAEESGVSYYYFGDQRVAMRKEGVIYWLAGDHLGTISVVLDAAGSVVAESRAQSELRQVLGLSNPLQPRQRVKVPVKAGQERDLPLAAR